MEVVQMPQKGFSDINDLKAQGPWSLLLRLGGPWLV